MPGLLAPRGLEEAGAGLLRILPEQQRELLPGRAGAKPQIECAGRYDERTE